MADPTKTPDERDQMVRHIRAAMAEALMPFSGADPDEVMDAVVGLAVLIGEAGYPFLWHQTVKATIHTPGLEGVAFFYERRKA